MLDFLRTLDGYEDIRLHAVARHIGVRESRRIRGLAYLTLEDFKAARKFPDAIARCRYNVDIHNPDGEGTAFYHLPPDEFVKIPYGCLVPQNATNLLMGCRAISVDHGMHSSIRVMPPIISIGQAAGLAAARAAESGQAPGKLDGLTVRRELIKFGAELE